MGLMKKILAIILVTLIHENILSAAQDTRNASEEDDGTTTWRMALSTKSSIQLASEAASTDSFLTAENNTKELPSIVVKRWYCFNASKPLQIYQKKCCRAALARYKKWYYGGGYYLTTILERLQRWECEEFLEECEKRTFAFTEFTKLVYDRFCNRVEMEAKCADEVRQVVQEYGFIEPPPRRNEIRERRWTVLIDSLNSKAMHLDDLTKPCVQIAMFDRTKGGVGRFHEIVEPYIPFCPVIWSGYDIDTATERNVSPWTSMTLRCKASIAVCMVVVIIAGIVTVVANSTILAVFIVTPKLRNSQAIYKISLAIADLLVGITIWPNMITMQVWMFMYPRTMGRIVTPPTENSTKWVAYFPFTNESLVSRFSGGYFASIFARPYIGFMGFVTSLGLAVSIYTLMTASFDRFSAVFRPLRYNKHNAKRQAKYVCASVWVLSFLLSLLPIFVDSIKYNVMSPILVASDGTLALALLAGGFLAPLILTWIVTVATFQTSKKHARNRQRIVSSNSTRSASLEARLARTLALMVGIFTLSILPAMMCVIAGFFLSYAQWGDPDSLDVNSAMIYLSSEYVAIIFLTANSLWNCFIYSLRTHGFQEASSQIYSDLMEKSGIKFIGRGAMHMMSSARRISLTSLYTMRKMSNTSVTDLRKKSVTSLASGTTKTGFMSQRPSVDIDSSSYIDGSTVTNGHTATYTKTWAKGNKAQYSGVELRAERKKQQKEEGFAGEDSTFGSFAIDAGADRFFHSVMENVEEKVEEEEMEQNNN